MAWFPLHRQIRRKDVLKWMLVAGIFIIVSLSMLQYGLRTVTAIPITAPRQYTPDDLRGSLLDLSNYAIVNKTVPLEHTSDLHTLPDNDAFLPYFAVISQIQNLTVETAIGACNYSAKELESFHYDHTAWWKVKSRPDNETSKIRSEWQTFVTRGLIAWSAVSDRFQGRGIVIVAGQSESIKRAKVTLRALKNYGSELDVEICFYGKELNEKTKNELRVIYNWSNRKVFFNDLSRKDLVWWPTYYAKWGLNYQLKTAAMLNTRFLEPLLLDSDNIPAYDPAVLWESQSYREYGAVFWPDITRSRPENPAWAITNTPCRRDEYEFESGQVLVDKRRVWYHLQLAAWMNTERYWSRIVLGDKDLFRYAWHALKTEFATPKKWVTSVGFMAESADQMGRIRQQFCGHTFAQAHPDHSSLANDTGSGIAFLHGGTLKTVSAPVAARLRWKGGLFTHYKRVHVDTLEHWEKIEYGVGLGGWDAGRYLDRTKDLPVTELVSSDEDLDKDGVPILEEGLKRLELTEKDLSSSVVCTDFEHVEPRPLSDFGGRGMEFEKIFEHAGGYWIIEDGYRRP